jgi:hypothetical protein
MGTSTTNASIRAANFGGYIQLVACAVFAFKQSAIFRRLEWFVTFVLDDLL